MDCPAISRCSQDTAQLGRSPAAKLFPGISMHHHTVLSVGARDLAVRGCEPAGGGAAHLGLSHAQAPCWSNGQPGISAAPGHGCQCFLGPEGERGQVHGECAVIRAVRVMRK